MFDDKVNHGLLISYAQGSPLSTYYSHQLFLSSNPANFFNQRTVGDECSPLSLNLDRFFESKNRFSLWWDLCLTGLGSINPTLADHDYHYD